MGDELKVIIDSANCSSSLSKCKVNTQMQISNHLVELQHVKELKELPVLLGVLQLDVVLPQTVQGELRLVVDVHLHRLQARYDNLT